MADPTLNPSESGVSPDPAAAKPPAMEDAAQTPPEPGGAVPDSGEVASEQADENAALTDEGATLEEQPVESEPDTVEEESEDAIEAATATAGDAEENGEQGEKNWYILKVQSNREESIKDGLLRRVKIAGLEEHFNEVVVPTETITEYGKEGKPRKRKQKLWPGYIVVHMEINDDTWFLVRETPGIGDFTGAGGKPTPMQPNEVEKIKKLLYPDQPVEEQGKVKISVRVGDHVKITDGTFQGFDGEVESVDSANRRITVVTEIFGRPTPVEVDYFQIESM